MSPVVLTYSLVACKPLNRILGIKLQIYDIDKAEEQGIFFMTDQDKWKASYKPADIEENIHKMFKELKMESLILTNLLPKLLNDGKLDYLWENLVEIELSKCLKSNGEYSQTLLSMIPKDKKLTSFNSICKDQKIVDKNLYMLRCS